MVEKTLNVLERLCVNKAFFVLLPLLTLSCTQHKVGVLQGRTMGTTYSVKIGEAHKASDLKSLKTEIEKVLAEVNRQMSTYIKDSEISKLNQAQAGEKVVISSWFSKVLMHSLNLAEQTDGAYDPTLGPLVNLWGFGPQGNKTVPAPAQIKTAQKDVGHDKISLAKVQDRGVVIKKTSGVYVDLSSSAKGFGVDQISELLIEKGWSNHLAEIGGELKARGKKFKKDWIVGVEKPSDGLKSVQIAFPLKNMSIATSGDYRNFFKSGDKKYSHTIDRLSGRPVSHKLFSVTVLSENCMTADALATALMALGPEKAENFAYENDLAVFLIYESKDGKLVEHSSPRFQTFKL